MANQLDPYKYYYKTAGGRKNTLGWSFMGLIPGVQQSDLGLFKEYNEVPGAYCRSTTKGTVLIKVLQQNARGWFQEYNKMPGADFKSTKKCPRLIQMPGVQQTARGWSQEYIKMPEADPIAGR